MGIGCRTYGEEALRRVVHRGMIFGGWPIGGWSLGEALWGESSWGGPLVESLGGFEEIIGCLFFII